MEDIFTSVNEDNNINIATEDINSYENQLLKLQTQWCKTIDEVNKKGLKAGYVEVGKYYLIY